MRSRLLTAVAAALSVASCSSSTTGGEQTTAPPAHYSEPGTSTPSPRAPEATDFRIDVIITSKQCFSAQSCVYSYYVDPWPTASYPAQIPGTKLTVIGFVDALPAFFLADERRAWRDECPQPVFDLGDAVIPGGVALFDLVFGLQRTKIAGVLVSSGLADALGRDSRDPVELAQELGLDPGVTPPSRRG